MSLPLRILPALLALLLVTGSPSFSPPLWAQEDEATGVPADEGLESDEFGEEEEGVLAPLPDFEDIDQILEGEEDLLTGGQGGYDAGNRRDPFKSLMVTPDKIKFRGKRPEGVPGLMIDEILLSGIFKTKNGYIAQVQAADRQKSFLLKVGDQLFDGDVISITAKEVVFKQNIQDPTALRPFREVVKSLNP
ncbi:MAG TPA: hypothetical protein VF017_20935 [Thermoanaerobaculia bacterium]|nr:hypothetical protein [Thermoanaerobaculia bacterium]